MSFFLLTYMIGATFHDTSGDFVLYETEYTRTTTDAAQTL